MHARARSAERSMSFDRDDLTAASYQPSGEHDEAIMMSSLEDDNEGHLQKNQLESENNIGKQLHMLNLRRAHSDPFESAGNDDEEVCGGESGLPLPSSPRRYSRVSMIQEEVHALPTFNRFPFAETKNRNCWSEPPHNIFMIRGPNYFLDKKKITCQKFLLQSIGCDLFLSDHPHTVNFAK
jgi:Protein ENHANCED DISEASE RESISTANCE 2, C-terminal